MVSGLSINFNKFLVELLYKIYQLYKFSIFYKKIENLIKLKQN